MEKLFAYYQKWTTLSNKCKIHRIKSTNDMTAITSAQARPEGLSKALYGAVFYATDEGKFLSQPVLLGAPGQDSSGNPTYQVQAAAGSPAEERAVFLPDNKDGLGKDAENWVVQMDDPSKTGILPSGPQPQFAEYQERLLALSQLVREMSDIQRTLLQGLDEIAKKSPSFVFGYNMEENLAKSQGFEAK